jgi:hypothetical protein
MDTGSCLTSTDWQLVAPTTTMMTISQRRASAVYDRYNFTILDVTKLSDPSPVTYEPEDFFGFYDAIFAIDINQTDWSLSTQYSFLVSLSSYLGFDQHNEIDAGGGVRQLRLQEFLATPIAIFNDAWLGEPAEDMGKSLALAIPSYRVFLNSH